MIALWERRRRVRPGDCLNAGVMAFSQCDGSAKVAETLILSSMIHYQQRDAGLNSAYIYAVQSFDLFTDGACSGNPGPGGWGFILREIGGFGELLQSGAEHGTTNNRMELTAVIRGFDSISKPSQVRVISDSEYVVKGLKEWLTGWKVRGWKTAAKKPVKNIDLWQQLDQIRAIHTVNPVWIRGHAEHPENTKCDEMAVAAIVTLRNR